MALSAITQRTAWKDLRGQSLCFVESVPAGNSPVTFSCPPRQLCDQIGGERPEQDSDTLYRF